MEELKSKLIEMANQAVEGEVNEIAVYIELNEISKLVNDLKKQVLPCALHQADREDKKTFDHGNFTVTKSSKTTWSFKHLKDWNEKKEDIKAFEERAKTAHGMREAIICQETGEVVEPAHKSVSETLMIKPRKA